MDDNTKYQKSTIDDLFFGIFGFYPSKAGQAYEMLVSAVLKLVLNKDIEYNQFERGIYSETVYQLDGLIRGDNYPIEAKDYTLRDSKVGRPDLQKLEGALAVYQ